MTALAAALHRQLRDEADRRGVFKADVVLDAYEHHAGTVRAERAAGPGLPRMRRRRAVEDATQCQLYLTDSERRRLDELAAEAALSRSEVVSRLVELELADAERAER